MKNIQIDTDVLSDVSRNVPEAVNCLQAIESHVTLQEESQAAALDTSQSTFRHRSL